jgi:Methyltransferase domain
MSDKRDYVSPGLVTAYNAERDFPDRIEGDPTLVPWKWMRKNDPHKWYCDRTMPTAGFINADETAILFNTALQFAGKPALEIGVLFGWSTWHLMTAGVELTAIDPLLRRIDKALYSVLPRHRNVTWCSEESPAAIYRRAPQKWSLIFIDANHDAPHPMLDTIAAEHAAADDALIMFHDVIAPDVFEAVRFLRWKGWKTRIYNTSQVMAACWRGDVAPIDHTPDPAIEALPLPDHLSLYAYRPGRMSFSGYDHDDA